MDVGAVALEVRMRLHLNLDHEVAGRATEARIALLRYAQVHAIVHALRNVYRLLHLLVRRATASARHAWTLDHSACSIAVAADLLDHERALADGLEACTATGAAPRLAGARLRSRALAGRADVRAAERDALLAPVDGIHEVDLALDDDVLALLRTEASALTSLALPSSTKELLKFFENVSEAVLSTATAFLELILEAFEARETAKAATEATERVLAASSLVLLIASHPCHIVHPFLRFISQRLVRLVDLRKPFFGTGALVHVGMVLLGLLEVRLLDFISRRVAVEVQRCVIVF